MNVVHNSTIAINLDHMILAVRGWNSDKTRPKVTVFMDARDRVIERVFFDEEAEHLWKYLTAGKLALDRGSG